MLRNIDYLTSALVIAMLAGCTSADEQCNTAKVASSDAWRAVQDELSAPCGLFAGQAWTDVYDDGREGLQRAMLGRASEWDATAGAIASCMDGYRPQLLRACRAIARARTTATAGAVAARDAANEAQSAVDSVLGGHAGFASCMQRNAAAVQSRVRQRTAERQGAFEGLDPQVRRTLEAISGDTEWERADSLISAAREHSQALGASNLRSLLTAARTASDASFDACQAVSP